ncbi:MAG: IS110 family transposase [Patescibacteria group bacterium]|nr:IS110 family transposase [Patescibacteria group bacterium]
MKSIAYVGVDAHLSTLSVCVMVMGSQEPVFQTKLVNSRNAVKKCFGKLADKYDLRVCYEASSCGFVLYRWLTDMELDCVVIAPSLVAKKPGDRVKTDRRDAALLARELRGDNLTPVRVPSPEEEADRGLMRLRGSLCRDVVRSKNQVLKFLTARGCYYREPALPKSGKKQVKLSHWTQKHWAWLNALEFTGSDGIVWEQMIGLLKEKVARLQTMDKHIADLAQTDRYQAAVGKLCCLRGVATLTAMVLLTEIGDFARFGNARQLMSYVGLIPSEHSSGDTRRQGAITKAGNSRTRHVLVEAAWKYKSKPETSSLLRKRREGQPEEVVAHATKAQKRLHAKFWSVADKDLCKAAVAVARELAGFVWALMTGNCGASSDTREAIVAA